jgi:uncharacterized protein
MSKSGDETAGCGILWEGSSENIVRVVISGGTGFVGRAVVHALMARGDVPVVLTRGRPRWVDHACGECGAGSKAELVTWTPEEPGDWQSTIDGVDAVINLAGANVGDGRWTPERMEAIRSSRVRSTELLSDAIVAAKRKPKVFVSASACGYYGIDTEDRVLAEDAPPGNDFLAEVCKEWEAAAESVRKAGVRVVHPRLGIVLGRGGGVLQRMLPFFRAFLGGPVGDGEQYVSWVHMRDVVHAFEAMIERDDLAGPFNVTAPEPVTMNAFAETLAEVMHRPAIFRVPEFAVKLAMGQMSEVLLTGPRAVPRRLVDAGYAFVFPELASALADLV